MEFKNSFQNFDNTMEIENANNDESIKKEKYKKLEKIKNEIEQTIDFVGTGVDENIKEMVVIFNALGLFPVASCEGHLDHGFSAPWIEIGAPNQPEERFVEENIIFEKVAKKYDLTLKEVKRGMKKEETFMKPYFEALAECSKNNETEKHLKWRSKTEKLRKRIENLLEEFYKKRKVEELVKLEIDDNGDGSFRVHNGGNYEPASEERLSKMSIEEKTIFSEKLMEYQQEMKDFTEFLKNKYLNEK